MAGAVEEERRDRAAETARELVRVPDRHEAIGDGVRDERRAADLAQPAAHEADPVEELGDSADRRDTAPALPKLAPATNLPATDLPAAGSGQQKLQQAAADIDSAGQNAVNNVDQTVRDTTQNAQTVLSEPQNLLPNVGTTAGGALDDVNKTVDDATNDVSNAVGGLLKP